MLLKFCAFKRMASTVPVKISEPYVPTWNPTCCPGRTRPMLASSTQAVSLSVSSGVQRRKKFGDVMLACTVWPMLTRRWITTPSIGE